MAGRFLILALCIFGVYSLPVSQNNNILAAQPAISIPDTGVVNWPVVEDVAEKIESILEGLKTRSSLTQAQIDEIINAANQIEGIVNIHSLENAPKGGVINIPGFLDAIQSIIGSATARSSLTQAQIDEIINVANQIEGIVNIHSLENAPKGGVINIPGFLDAIQSIIGSATARSSLTQAQIDEIINVANQIEGIVNIHSLENAPKGGVINIPGFLDAIQSIIGSATARSSLTQAQIDEIINVANQIEGIVNIHSLENAPKGGVINIPGFLDAIQSIIGSATARSSLTQAQIDEIINVANQIEGIVNIHSLENAPKGGVINIPGFLDAIQSIIGSATARSSLTQAQIDEIINVANQIEGIVNIHSLENAPKGGVINIPGFLDAIQSIIGSATARSSLTQAQIDEIINVANQIEGIVNIHSLENAPKGGVINIPGFLDAIQSIIGSATARSSLTEAQIDEIINVANQIEGIVNIHSLENAPKGGVINIPGFLDAIQSIIGSATARSSLTQAQIDEIINVANQIEGIVNIHSLENAPKGGVINIPGFLDAIQSIIGSATARSSLTQAQIDEIINVANQIEGIVNIHSLENAPKGGVINIPGFLDAIQSIIGSATARSSLTQAQIDEIINVANQIEGIVNIHSLENAPKGGVINIPGFLDAIQSIIGSATARSSLTQAQIDEIINVANQIEGIVNIHSLEIEPEAQSTLTPTDIESIINVLNKIEGIINIH